MVVGDEMYGSTTQEHKVFRTRDRNYVKIRSTPLFRRFTFCLVKTK